MRVEIVHYRDSDGPCDHTVFIDGRRVEADVYTADPGAGGIGPEYWQHRDECLASASSDEVKRVIDEAFGD